MANNESSLSEESFGEVIRKARDAKGLTQKELAKSCGGVSPMFISQIETGERFPSVNVCIQLAKALDLDEKRLLRMILRTKVPKEMKDFVIKEKAGDYGDSRLTKLLDDINQLSNDKKEHMIKIIQVALEGVAT